VGLIHAARPSDVLDMMCDGSHRAQATREVLRDAARRGLVLAPSAAAGLAGLGGARAVAVLRLLQERTRAGDVRAG
jgi:hypothetical protein